MENRNKKENLSNQLQQAQRTKQERLSQLQTKLDKQTAALNYSNDSMKNKKNAMETAAKNIAITQQALESAKNKNATAKLKLVNAEQKKDLTQIALSTIEWEETNEISTKAKKLYDNANKNYKIAKSAFDKAKRAFHQEVESEKIYRDTLTEKIEKIIDELSLLTEAENNIKIGGPDNLSAAEDQILKARSPDIYEDATEGLEAGPRSNKSTATRELEEIVMAFLDEEKNVICSCNEKGEVEVTINNQQPPKNLTQILKHEPDFHRLSENISKPDFNKFMNNYAKFLEKSAYVRPKILLSDRDNHEVIEREGFPTALPPSNSDLPAKETTGSEKSLNSFIRSFRKGSTILAEDKIEVIERPQQPPISGDIGDIIERTMDTNSSEGDIIGRNINTIETKFPTEKDYAERDKESKFTDLSYAEKLAITLYSGSFYPVVNSLLREGITEQSLSNFSHQHNQDSDINNLFSNATLTQQVKEALLAATMCEIGLSHAKKTTNSNEFEISYRGEGGNTAMNELNKQRKDSKNSLGEKNVVKHDAPTSTSQYGKVAAKFTKGKKNPTTTTIVAPASLGVKITPLATYPDEREILFPRSEFVYRNENSSNENENKFIAVPVRPVIKSSDPQTSDENKSTNTATSLAGTLFKSKPSETSGKNSNNEADNSASNIRSAHHNPSTGTNKKV